MADHTNTQPSRTPVSHIREHPELIASDLKALMRVAPDATRVLDIGAGPGGFVASARSAGLVAVGVDIEPSAAGLWSALSLPCVLGDGYRLPFAAGAFDVVRIKEVIEHVTAPLDLLRAATSVLTPRGIVLAHVPSPYSQFFPVANFWDDYTHVRPLTKTGLRRLFTDAGLDVIEVHGYIAGRNSFERMLGGVVGRILPHTYRVIGRHAPL
jgi:SAM-dependent methyltransferase